MILRPAPSGTGIIAGGAIRSILDVAGYRNVVCKIWGPVIRRQILMPFLKL